METVSEEFKKRFAKAERSGQPTAETRQVINILSALDIPKGVSISGELANFFVYQAQQRGVEVPDRQLSAVEMRSFQTQVMSKCKDFDVRIDPEVRQQLLSKAGIVVKKSAPEEYNRYKYWTDEMLEMQNNLYKDIALADELRAHPLLKFAMKRSADSRVQTPVRRTHKKR